MTEEQWRYHRQTSKQVQGLGECSRMQDGCIKIEGYAPVQPADLTPRQLKALQDAGLLP